MSQAPSHFPFAVCPGTENETINFRIVGTKDGKLNLAGVRGSHLWPYNNSTKGYRITFRWSGDTSRRAVVKSVFDMFEECSGIKFTPASSPPGSICIHFASDDNAPAWNAIGTTADKIPSETPTLTLPLGFTVAQVYHVVGHALGLEHEWDGKMGLENTRHGELFKGQQLSNFPPLNSNIPVKTIMRYDIDNTQTELSELDKAWLAINYPKKKKNANGKTIQSVIDDVKRRANIFILTRPGKTEIY